MNKLSDTTDFLNEKASHIRSNSSIHKSFSQETKSLSFNYNVFLKSLQTSLNSLLTNHDQILNDEFRKMEKKKSKRADLQNNDEENQNLSESLSKIRKSLFRKKKVAENDHDIYKEIKNVGKDFSETIKYANVDNKKALKHLRLCAEYRDLLNDTFEAIIFNLTDELNGINDIDLNKHNSHMIRKNPIEIDLNCLNLNSNDLSRRLFSMESKKKINDSYLSSQQRSSLPKNNNSTPMTKKTKNLNEFILK